MIKKQQPIPDQAPIWFCGNALEWNLLKTEAGDQATLVHSRNRVCEEHAKAIDYRTIVGKAATVAAAGSAMAGCFFGSGLPLPFMLIAGMWAGLGGAFVGLVSSKWIAGGLNALVIGLAKKRLRMAEAQEVRNHHSPQLKKVESERFAVIAEASSEATRRLTDNELWADSTLSYQIYKAADQLSKVRSTQDQERTCIKAPTEKGADAQKNPPEDTKKRQELLQKIAADLAQSLPKAYQARMTNVESDCPLMLRLATLQAVGSDGVAALTLLEDLMANPFVSPFELAQMKVTVQERLPRLLSAFESIPNDEREQPLEVGAPSATDFLKQGLASALAGALEIRKAQADRAKLNTQLEAQVFASVKELKM